MSRAAQIRSVLSILDAWNAARDKGGTISDTMEALLQVVDWNEIPYPAVRRFMAALLTAAPDAELDGIADIAGPERQILDDYLERKTHRMAVSKLLGITEDDADKVIADCHKDEPAERAVVN